MTCTDALFWREVLQTDLRLRVHAHEMLVLAHSLDQRQVVLHAMVNINRTLSLSLHTMGGLAGEW